MAYNKYKKAKRYPKRSNYVKKVVRNEMKKNIEYKTAVFEPEGVVNFGQAFTDASQIRTLNVMGQGTTQSTFTGREYIIKSIELRGEVVSPVDVATRNRWCIVVDKHPTGSAAPNMATIFENTATTGCLYNTLREEYKERFKIIKDKYFVLSGNAFQDGRNTMIIKYYKKFNLKCAGTDTPTVLRAGAIYLCTMGNTLLAPPNLKFVVKVKYTDA